MKKNVNVFGKWQVGERWGVEDGTVEVLVFFFFFSFSLKRKIQGRDVIHRDLYMAFYSFFFFFDKRRPWISFL